MRGYQRGHTPFVPIARATHLANVAHRKYTFWAA